MIRGNPLLIVVVALQGSILKLRRLGERDLVDTCAWLVEAGCATLMWVMCDGVEASQIVLLVAMMSLLVLLAW